MSSKNVSVNEQETSRVFPVDMIGNEIRKHDLLMVRFPTENVICRVAEVRPVSLTDGMEIEGSIFLMVQLPHRGSIPVACVLKQPDEMKLSEGGSAAEIERLAAAAKVIKQ